LEFSYKFLLSAQSCVIDGEATVCESQKSPLLLQHDRKEIPRRALSKKEFRARVDRMIADEERTFGQLLEMQDRVTGIITELDGVHDPMAALPKISKIINTPSRFPWRFPPRPRG